MKIIICTTPIRPQPTSYPPFGSLAVIQSLRGAGYDPAFLDIDGLRPDFSEVVEHFRRESPDIIGISAVVSTAYGYVKNLCEATRKVLPNVKIVLGGNLAASAEILHRLCGVDVCVIGEGERVIVNLVNYYARHKGDIDYEELGQVKGITFINLDNEMIFTGYEAAISPEEMLDPDFSILEKNSNIGNFIKDPLSRIDFAQDSRSYEPHRSGKKMGTIIFTKGCVARCTFCHRWDKGFRQFDPRQVVERIKYLIERYNVGFVEFGDENFGSDRRAVDELIRLIKPLDVLWEVGGIRARTVDADLLKSMHDAGCVAAYYGFETGSPDILKIMEKNLELSHNVSAARWTHEAGIFTVYQLVLGMPGETHRTISETIEMLKQITEFLPNRPEEYLSINYIQALPGTPIYEYARAKGYLGKTIEDEEQYLISISDINAADDTKFLNFTAEPYFAVQSWRSRILYEVATHRARVDRQRGSGQRRVEGVFNVWHYDKGGYFNLHRLAYSPSLLLALYPIRWIPIWLRTFASVRARRSSSKQFLSRLWELLTWNLTKHEKLMDYRPLRKIVKDMAPKSITLTEESREPLRLGR